MCASLAWVGEAGVEVSAKRSFQTFYLACFGIATFTAWTANVRIRGSDGTFLMAVFYRLKAGPPSLNPSTTTLKATITINRRPQSREPTIRIRDDFHQLGLATFAFALLLTNMYATTVNRTVSSDAIFEVLEDDNSSDSMCMKDTGNELLSWIARSKWLCRVSYSCEKRKTKSSVDLKF